MTAELQAIVDLIALERDAIQYLTQRGFKVSRPKKAKESKEQPRLNAIGKPYGASYDPNYKMKYKTPALSRKQNLGPIEGWSYTNQGAWEGYSNGRPGPK